jgi:hypothetical protein
MPNVGSFTQIGLIVTDASLDEEPPVPVAVPASFCLPPGAVPIGSQLCVQSFDAPGGCSSVLEQFATTNATTNSAGIERSDMSKAYAPMSQTTTYRGYRGGRRPKKNHSSCRREIA